MVDNAEAKKYRKPSSTLAGWALWWIFWLSLIISGMLLAEWQWDRAQQKEALIQTWQSSRFQPPVVIPPANYSRIQLTGHWQKNQSLWWDNRIHKGQVGVSLVTPFTDQNGRHWLVNRGFFMTQGSRLQIPFPKTTSDEITIDGLWQDLSNVEPLLGVNREGNRIADIDSIHWSNIALVADGVIHQVAGPSLLTPHWLPNQNAAQRHYGYFMQWLLLATVALFIAIKYRPIMSLRRINKKINTPCLSPNRRKTEFAKTNHISGSRMNRSER